MKMTKPSSSSLTTSFRPGAFWEVQFGPTQAAAAESLAANPALTFPICCCCCCCYISPTSSLPRISDSVDGKGKGEMRFGERACV